MSGAGVGEWGVGVVGRWSSSVCPTYAHAEWRGWSGERVEIALGRKQEAKHNRAR
jgi:hypothetical protein